MRPLVNSLRAVGRAELAIDSMQMLINGREADHKLVGDQLVVEAFCQQHHHFIFADGQPRAGLWGVLWHVNAREYFARCISGWRATTGGMDEHRQALIDEDGFCQIIIAACPQGFVHRFGVEQPCHDDDLQLGHEDFQSARAFKAVHARHPDVRERQMRIDLGYQIDCFNCGGVHAGTGEPD